MKVAVIKYNAGNLQSVAFALNRLGIEPVITDDWREISKADKIIFPGVGEAGSAMKYLKSRMLDQVIKGLRKPVLGICLGMQLMCSFSEENGTTCLGIFNQTVKRFPPGGKVPHTGWNCILNPRGRLFGGIQDSSYFYFVHGFYVEKNVYTSAECHYISHFSAGMEKNNFFALQFHPEKSGARGEQVLRNFLKL